jgi:hypothetical protein
VPRSIIHNCLLRMGIPEIRTPWPMMALGKLPQQW